jgi:gamma-glutamyl-gamma-aminobutyrate hydrolase PuuD
MIGITSEMTAVGWGDRVREAALLPARYPRALQQAGCVPLMLAPWPRPAARLVASLDGLLLADTPAARRPGAGPPSSTGDPADQVRDAAESALVRAAIEAGLPVLAVGRGLHVLNLARGGAEHPSDPADQGRSELPARQLRLSPDSMLGQLLGPSVIVPAADLTGPALGRLGRGLTAVAWADDQAVEAVELAGHPFAIGMRWHPGESDGVKLFARFLAAAAARVAGRPGGAAPADDAGQAGEAGRADSTGQAGGTGQAESTGQAKGAPKAKAGTATT